VVDGRALAWGEGKFGTTKATLLIDETGGVPLGASFHVEQKSKPKRASTNEKSKKIKG
jgi:hypothetical protein